MTPILLIALTLAFDPATAVKPASPTAPVLWIKPKPATLSDWIWGPGGQARAPHPPFRFIRENLSGTNAKIEVRDAAGAAWIVKFGGEVHAETFAARLLNVAGYLAAPDYFVPSGVIEGVQGLKRARWFVSRSGSFRAARFRLRDPNLTYVAGADWSWTQNPFRDARELNGLKILLMLLSNWDAKDARDGAGGNTAVFADTQNDFGVRYYAFTDWGASLGSWGGLLRRDRWNASAYERQTRDFVRVGRDGTLVWGYRGKHDRDITTGPGVEDVRWTLQQLSGVDHRNLRAALLASGATDAEAERFTRAIEDRIAQLKRVAVKGGAAE
jgi:hypothetical protein